jgi:predicted DNA-binding protein
MPNKPKRTTDRHKQKTVSFRLPEGLMDSFRKLADRNRRTLSGEVRIAIENHLAANGVPTDDEKLALDGRKRG